MPAQNNLICILCGCVYDYRSYGKMSCWIHPYSFDGNKGYYPCCGLTENKYDPYFKETNRIRGCTKIDHVHSSEELNRLKQEPYFVIPVDKDFGLEILQEPHRWGIDKKVFKTKTQNDHNGFGTGGIELCFKKGRIFPITSEDQLNLTQSFETFDDIIKLDFRILYNMIQDGDYNLDLNEKDFFPMDDDDDDDDDDENISSNFFHYSHKNIEWEESSNFKMFYVIRRMDSAISRSRLMYGKEEIYQSRLREVESVKEREYRQNKLKRKR